MMKPFCSHPRRPRLSRIGSIYSYPCDHHRGLALSVRRRHCGRASTTFAKITGPPKTRLLFAKNLVNWPQKSVYVLVYTLYVHTCAYAYICIWISRAFRLRTLLGTRFITPTTHHLYTNRVVVFFFFLPVSTFVLNTRLPSKFIYCFLIVNILFINKSILLRVQCGDTSNR